jgi:hypothetical protein
VIARVPVRVLGAVLPALVSAGCGLSGSHPGTPVATTTTTASVLTATGSATRGGHGGAEGRTAAKVARADRTHEVPTPAPAESVAGGWSTPAQAVDVFATRYINWNAQDVTAQLRALARVSVGQARSAMQQAAGGTATDEVLQQGGIANSGVVESIARVAGRRFDYVVVTRERTTATDTSAYRGLAAEWHVALATVTQTRGGLWVLSDWQPES